MTQGMRKGLTSYGDADFSLFLRKAFIKAMGLSDDALARPIVGIANTFSDYNACHGNVPKLVEAIKRGVMLAGGLPMEFPTISIHESFAYPTSMFLRNLMAMDTEEMLRAQPMDSVVLIGGCDKTIPAQMMAAASADVPAVFVPVGPMLVGHHKGEQLGACTDCRRLWGEHRGGRIDAIEIEAINERLAPTPGTCMVMGTASTMACIIEVMGLALPRSAAIPATHADRLRSAEASGKQAVAMAISGHPKPSEVMTAAAFRNALIIMQAIGGSTNGLIHLTAAAGRLGIPIDLAEVDRLGREVPVLVDLKPSGAHYMEHFHWAGGVPRLLHELQDLLALDAPTVMGGTLRDYMNGAEIDPGQQVIRPRADPINAQGSMAVLRGNLAPRGAIIKQSAASPKLMSHTGRAVVFDSVEDMALRIDSPDLDVNADDVLVLRNAGPIGAPGMPEAGYLPIPKKLGMQGVKDMVRLSDARMSGTAFGTIVLHMTPEAAIGGPLALVRNGDRIRLDVASRCIELLVDDAELAQRRAALPAVSAGAAPVPDRGYAALFHRCVLQADEGCDFDFLVPGRGVAGALEPVSLQAPECAPPQSTVRAPRVALPTGTCDSHIHVIGPTDRYPLDPRRNYTPVPCSLAQYRAVMAACGIARAVLVQPSVYGTDNRQLLDALREGGDAFRGVVVPAADVSDDEIDAMHALGVRGIRLNLVNPQVVGVDEVVALCARVAERGWHLQVQIRWNDTAQAALASVAARVGLPLVIDHMGRPDTMQAPRALLDLLASGRGWVKLSAPYRLSASDAPPYDDVRPLVRALLAANPDQGLWASDWPHTERFTPTPQDADLVDLLPDWLGSEDLIRRVCVTNPARLYGYPLEFS